MNEIKIGEIFLINEKPWQLIKTYITDGNIFMFRFYNHERKVFMNIRTEEFDNLINPKSNI